MNPEPDWVSPPGDTIARLMEMREIGADDMAAAMSLSSIEFDALIQGRRRLTGALAKALSDNLGSTPRFWLARDKSYLRDLTRLGQTDPATTDDWLRSMPVTSMRRFGWLAKNIRHRNCLAEELLSFFGCKSLPEWGERYSTGIGAVAFRTSLSFPADDMATLVWLRIGEMQADRTQVRPYSVAEFKDLLPNLKQISAHKRPASIMERLRDACYSAGVNVTSARAPLGCRASGASWFDANGNPVIHLSFRHLSDDHLWFTFFHEAAHIILHGHSHIDGDGVLSMSAEDERHELEADLYAREMLLPEQFRTRLVRFGGSTPNAIRRVAREAGVTPGIVVGQLEKENVIPYGRLSTMKRRYRWGENPYIPDLKD